MADSPLILPNTGRTYDPSVAQDHTGINFQSSLKSNEDIRRVDRRLYDAAGLIRKPAWHQCPKCRSVERFRLLVESDPMGDGLVQIICAACDSRSPIMALGQPQANDVIARRMGIEIPDPNMMSFDLDLERE